MIPSVCVSATIKMSGESRDASSAGNDGEFVEMGQGRTGFPEGWRQGEDLPSVLYGRIPGTFGRRIARNGVVR